MGTLFDRQPTGIDAQGAFSISALPQGLAYTLTARAPGYSVANTRLTPSETTTTNLKLPPLVLKAANLPLAGKVLGPDNQPVASVQVQISGAGQPSDVTRTDSQGRFNFKVSDGPVQVIAIAQVNGGNQQFATAQTQGGDTNVVVRFPASAAAGSLLGNALRTLVNASSALGLMAPPKPPAGSWAAVRLWPAEHKTTVWILAAFQLLALGTVAGGLFWFVRRQRPSSGLTPSSDEPGKVSVPPAVTEHRCNCPACGQKIACDPAAIGVVVTCPTCQAAFAVPPAPANPPVGSPAPPRPAPSRPPPMSPEDKARAHGAVVQVGPNYCSLAIASLIASVVLVVGWLPGIICGHLAKARIRRDPLLDGERLATAGLVVSYLSLVAVLCVTTGFALYTRSFKPVVMMRDSPRTQLELATRVVDEVHVGDPASESEHGLRIRRNVTGNPTGVDGTNHWRGAQYGEAFAYVLKVLPDRPMTLNCRFKDNLNQRLFDIVVNNQVVGGEVFRFNVPGHFYDVEYDIPTSLTRGQHQVTVEFRSHNDIMIMCRLYGCQMLRP